jgi:hypothetical protein
MYVLRRFGGRDLFRIVFSLPSWIGADTDFFSVLVIAGDWQMGPEVTPLDPTSVKSVVEYGTAPGTYTMSANGTSEVYSQLYPFPDTLNYTSGIIHHARITGNTPFPFSCSYQSMILVAPGKFEFGI